MRGPMIIAIKVRTTQQIAQLKKKQQSLTATKTENQPNFCWK